MFKKLSGVFNFYKENPYEFILICVIILILGVGIYRKIRGMKGSWSSWKETISPDSLKLSKKDFKPRLKDSKGETEARRVLETIFRKPFKKDRPDFLRNPVTGNINNLELDCYNKELNIAVEYNGIQHYKYVPFFHSSKEAFENQKYRDYVKRDLCSKNGVVLIEIPYTVKEGDIYSFLVGELKKRNLLQ